MNYIFQVILEFPDQLTEFPLPDEINRLPGGKLLEQHPPLAPRF